MVKDNIFLLHKTNNKNKKNELLQYFKNTYKEYELLFKILKDDKAYYIKAHKHRHPLIFYFGHTAVFYINKLFNMGLIKNRINEEFERIFAVGVDEMKWDDLDSSNYNWPTVKDIIEYRDLVFNVVVNCVENMKITLPIKWDDPAWIVLMGIEHERIHLETSSVLIRQLPIEFVKSNSRYKSCNNYSKPPTNSLIKVKEGKVDIGRQIASTRYYGWDNEFGVHKSFIKSFLASKFLVSNKEFLEFFENNGYKKAEFWSKDGWKWLTSNNIKHPEFWIIKDEIKQRNLTEIIKLPLSWPVEVNYYEAEAFCNYISKRDNKNYTLPTEDEWHRLYDLSKDNIKSANINLSMYASSMPVDTNKHGEFYDIIGNVWQWCKTSIYPFDGFCVHRAYDDFSIPTFDDKHNIIKGGSWISTSNLMMSKSRYAFRKHFYQHAGFRYVVSDSQKEIKNSIYESDFLLSQYCEFHYGDRYFGVENFSKTLADIAIGYMDNNMLNKALDIGCAVGRCSFELSKKFENVVGIDYSARFIRHAIDLQNNGNILYKLIKEGDSYIEKKVNIDNFDFKDSAQKVEFWQGDASNLKSHFKDFDLIVAANLIDRLKEPSLFLQNIHKRLNKNGILLISSPYTWLEDITPKNNWLCQNKDGKINNSLDTIKSILSKHFKLLDIKDVEFVIRETSRKYQHTISEVTIWKKL